MCVCVNELLGMGNGVIRKKRKEFFCAYIWFSNYILLPRDVREISAEATLVAENHSLQPIRNNTYSIKTCMDDEYDGIMK